MAALVRNKKTKWRAPRGEDEAFSLYPGDLCARREEIFRLAAEDAKVKRKIKLMGCKVERRGKLRVQYTLYH
jgi:hypothetical protein